MHNLHLEARLIAQIAEQIAPMCDGDEELLHDMMTGETRIDHLVMRLHEQVARDGEQLLGIAARQESLSERKERIARRQGGMKAAIGTLMRAARLTKLELPDVSYSVREGKATLKIVDPDGVPRKFQREAKREPDKTKINEAFDGAERLPNWLVREPARDVIVARTK